MTQIYFIRHAEPNYENKNDMERELTPKGMKDRESVTAYLEDKNIHNLISSPYKRAIDTIAHFANQNNLEVSLIDNFRERRITSQWIEDYEAFSRNQWSDFSYKYADGESLEEVQTRNIAALQEILKNYKDRNIAIATHGIALSTIIHYFDSSFGYEEFQAIKGLFPWIVKFTFDEKGLVGIERYDLAV